LKIQCVTSADNTAERLQATVRNWEIRASNDETLVELMIKMEGEISTVRGECEQLINELVQEYPRQNPEQKQGPGGNGRKL
jgi:hypothetical protein